MVSSGPPGGTFKKIAKLKSLQRLRRNYAKYLLFSADYSAATYQFEPEWVETGPKGRLSKEVSWNDEKARSLARSVGRWKNIPDLTENLGAIGYCPNSERSVLI